MALVSLIKNTPNVFMLLKCYFKGGGRGCVKKLGGGDTLFAGRTDRGSVEASRVNCFEGGGGP